MRRRKLSQHDRGCLIDETTACDTEDGVLTPPLRRKRFLVENGQMFLYCIFSNALYRRRCLCIGGHTYLRRRSVIVIRNVAGKFANGISDLCEAFLVKRAALCVDLRQLQTL